MHRLAADGDVLGGGFAAGSLDRGQGAAAGGGAVEAEESGVAEGQQDEPVADHGVALEIRTGVHWRHVHAGSLAPAGVIIVQLQPVHDDAHAEALLEADDRWRPELTMRRDSSVCPVQEREGRRRRGQQALGVQVHGERSVWKLRLGVGGRQVGGAADDGPVESRLLRVASVQPAEAAGAGGQGDRGAGDERLAVVVVVPARRHREHGLQRVVGAADDPAGGGDAEAVEAKVVERLLGGDAADEDRPRVVVVAGVGWEVPAGR